MKKMIIAYFMIMSIFVDSVKADEEIWMRSINDLTEIGRMSNGDKGYTVSWCFCRNEDGSMFVNSHYTIDPEEHGTVHIYVEKKNEKVYVDMSTFDSDYDDLDECTSWNDMRVYPKPEGGER